MPHHSVRFTRRLRTVNEIDVEADDLKEAQRMVEEGEVDLDSAKQIDSLEDSAEVHDTKQEEDHGQT